MQALNRFLENLCLHGFMIDKIELKQLNNTNWKASFCQAKVGQNWLFPSAWLKSG